MCGMYVFNDEFPILDNVLTFFDDRTIVPSHFAYPTLFSYLATLPTLAGAGILYIARILPSIGDVGSPLILDWVVGVLAARITSTVFGVLTLLVVFDAGRRFYSAQAGTLAAALVAFSSLHLTYSGYALPDVTMTFFAACSMRFALAALESGGRRDVLLGAAFGGLTASTKYNGALVMLAVAYAQLVRVSDAGRRPWRRRIFNTEWIAIGAIAAAAFLLGSPGWLITPAPFYLAIAHESAHMRTGHQGFFGVPYMQQIVLAWQWEKTFAILAAASLVHAAWKRTPREIALLSVVVPAFLIIGSWQKQDLHYLLFVYPIVALLSGALVVDAARGSNSRRGRVAVVCVAGAMAAWPVYQCLDTAYRETRVDSRWIAADWIQQNIPEGARLVVEDEHSHLPRLFTAAEKDRLLGGPHHAFFGPHLSATRTYELIPLIYKPGAIAEVTADYLLIGSFTFARFFDTPVPPADNPLYQDYVDRRDAYVQILERSKDNGWKLQQVFDTGKGPQLRLYRRTG